MQSINIMQKLHCKIMILRLLGAFSVSETGLYINTSNEHWLPAKGQEISEEFFLVFKYSKLQKTRKNSAPASISELSYSHEF